MYFLKGKYNIDTSNQKIFNHMYAVKKIGIDTQYSDYTDLKERCVVAQGWDKFDPTFLLDSDYSSVREWSDYVGDFEQRAWNAFKNLLLEIKAGQIILAFEGNSIKGICEIPQSFTFFNDQRNNCTYKNSLFPVQWVDWSSFYGKPFDQGGQGVGGVQNCNIQEINDYINKNWIAYKTNNNISVFPAHCKDYFDELVESLEDRKMQSKLSYELIRKKDRLQDAMKEYIYLLEANKNLVLTGAPGTGKTYLAYEIANAISKNISLQEFSKA